MEAHRDCVGYTPVYIPALRIFLVQIIFLTREVVRVFFNIFFSGWSGFIPDHLTTFILHENCVQLHQKERTKGSIAPSETRGGSVVSNMLVCQNTCWNTCCQITNLACKGSGSRATNTSSNPLSAPPNGWVNRLTQPNGVRPNPPFPQKSIT